MSDSRDKIGSIAEHLGCATDTVVPIRRLYCKGGVEALCPIKPPGRPGRATPEFRRQMWLAVQANPMTLGYGFSTWSVALPGSHLAETTGIRFGTDQIGRILRRDGFSFQRPKHTVKGKRNWAAFEKSKAELMVLKKGDEEECRRGVGVSGRGGDSSTPHADSHVGARRFATGKMIQTIDAIKCGVNFLAFLITSVAAFRRGVRQLNDHQKQNGIHVRS